MHRTVAASLLFVTGVIVVVARCNCSAQSTFGIVVVVVLVVVVVVLVVVEYHWPRLLLTTTTTMMTTLS